MAEFPSWLPFSKREAKTEAAPDPLRPLEDQIYAIGTEFGKLAPVRSALVESEPDKAIGDAIEKGFDTVNELERALFTKPPMRAGGEPLDRTKTVHYRAREIESFKQDLWRHADKVFALYGLEKYSDASGLELSVRTGNPRLQKYEDTVARISNACDSFLQSYATAFPNGDRAMEQFEGSDRWPYA